MSIFEYNQEEHIRMEREEAKKEALTNAPFKENRVTPRKCVLLGANIFGGGNFSERVRNIWHTASLNQSFLRLSSAFIVAKKLA